jgi:hypothetical protein
MINESAGQFVKTRNFLFNTADIQLIECESGHGGGVTRLYVRGRQNSIEVGREDFNNLIAAIAGAPPKPRSQVAGRTNFGSQPKP